MRLHGETRLDQFQRADAADNVMRRADRDIVALDEGAAADPPFDQAVILQIEQDLADGAARGIEALGQFPLGRQLIAVYVNSAANCLAQLGCDIADMAAALAESRAGCRPDFLSRRACVVHSSILPNSTQIAILT